MNFYSLPPILAQNYNDVTAVQFAAVVASIGAIMGILLLGTNLKEKWSPKPKSEEKVNIGPNPLPVEITKCLATKDELVALEEDVTAKFSYIQDQINEERRSAQAALSKVHERVDTLVENTSEIKGEVKQISINVDRVLSNIIKK